MSKYSYDLIVIGSGPAGQRAAIQAAKLGKRAAVIEQKGVVGGVCINIGTIPSKTMREAALYLSGYREKAVYGSSYSVKKSITMEDLLFRRDHVVRHEIDVIHNQLKRNDVDLINGVCSFTGPNSVRVERLDGSGEQELSADIILIAVGTTATRCEDIPFDGKRIFCSDDIVTIPKIPKTLTVIGGGVIGCEYTSIFSTLGVRVTLIDKRDRLLPFLDNEIADTLTYHLRQNRVTLRLGEEVSSVTKVSTSKGEQVKIELASGKQILSGAALYSIGRTGNSSKLNLEAAGLSADERGRVKVNESYQTKVPNIYAAGDIIGFPSLASTSMEQGRMAACHAFGYTCNAMPKFFPFGIYTIPEISTVGQSEEELTAAGIPYEIGKAPYREIARGQIIGDEIGLLKLLFHLETHELLGVHVIGEGASDLVHVGQAVMALGGKIDYFINSVFNYPTLSELYKTAAFDCVNRLEEHPGTRKLEEACPAKGESMDASAEVAPV